MDGNVVATAEVTGSTSTTLDCMFATLPADGAYKLTVATSRGLGNEFGVTIVRRNVQVKKIV